jgi:hypothetical protein
MPPRRFPPPWSVEEYNNACFIVRDNNRQQLAYVYLRERAGSPISGKIIGAPELLSRHRHYDIFSAR